MPLHPKPGEHGKLVKINHPSTPTGRSTWAKSDSIALFVPDGEAPPVLNSIALSRWADHPEDRSEWAQVDGILSALVEPRLEVAPGKGPAAGAVIEESDGRIWVVRPTNGYAGYVCTFPKGRAKGGLSLQATAIKECFEESGLRIAITGFLIDVDRGQTTTRYYRARRIGGTPVDCGWESQAVGLVPKNRLVAQLNAAIDHPIAWAVGAPKQM